jgi:non-heme Fe2+,alpha-ketoglutarate-dependent halogenase
MEQHRRMLVPQLPDKSSAIYHQGPTGPGSVIGSCDRHLDVDFLADIVTRPGVVDRVSSIIGPDVLCWRTELFPKYPGSEGTGWHQAETFASVGHNKSPQIQWPAGSQHSGTITVWFALTEATADNGCLQFIAGSHREMYYDESKILDYDTTRIGKVEKAGVKRGIYGLDFRQAQKDPDWAPDGSLPEASEAFQAAAAVFGEIGDKAHAAQAQALARAHVRRSRRWRG